MDSLRARLRASLTLALLASVCPFLVLTTLAAEEGQSSKPNYADQFPRKADAAGNPLPTKLLEIKLDASRRFTLPIRAPGVCYAGDLLMILLEAEWAKLKHVLISIEPVLESQPAGFSEKIPVNKLGNGKIAAKLTAPKVSAEMPMGIFICKDAAGTGSCRSKPLVPVDEVFNKYSDREKAEKLDPKKDFPDTIYFFTPVVVGPNSITASDGVYDTGERDRLTSIAKSSLSASEAAQVLARVQELQGGLNSSPLLEFNGLPTLMLPMLDRANCN